MFLSHLLIDVGENSDRPRPGRLWLRNLYRVHQRLCMAFPSVARVSDDSEFLKPFKSADFGVGQVHVERKTDAGFLFRIDTVSGGRVVLLVQSALEPDWEYAFHNAKHLLAAPSQVRAIMPSFTEGQSLRFRILANPTRKVDTKSGPDGKRRHGRRVPVTNDLLGEWLTARATAGGFEVNSECLVIQPGFVYVSKQSGGDGHNLKSARYDGILTVTDAEAFRETVVRGVGPGKAFGFGLLSVARA